MTPAPTPLLILDIDGTVRHGKDDPNGKWVHTPDDVVVFPEAIEMMDRWKGAGGRVIGCSNQGGVALGYLAEDDVDAAMDETEKQATGLFDVVVWCKHFPGAQHREYGYACWCRKPAPNMIFAGMELLHREYPDDVYEAHTSLMVGDLPVDAETAKKLNIPFMWARFWRDLAGLPQEGPR